MNKTVAHTFLPSLHNANGFICQERLLRPRDFVTIVTWRHTCPLYWENHEYHVAQNWISDVVKFLSTKNIMFSFKFQGTLCIRETSMKRGAMRESKDLFILDKGLTIYVVMCHSMNNPQPIIGKSTKKEWTNQYLPCWQCFTFAWLQRPPLFPSLLFTYKCFWSSVGLPPTSCTWAFPLCILVLYGELIPPFPLNKISPSQKAHLSLPSSPLKRFWNK